MPTILIWNLFSQWKNDSKHIQHNFVVNFTGYKICYKLLIKIKPYRMLNLFLDVHPKNWKITSNFRHKRSKINFFWLKLSFLDNLNMLFTKKTQKKLFDFDLPEKSNDDYSWLVENAKFSKPLKLPGKGRYKCKCIKKVSFLTISTTGYTMKIIKI